jgi:nucleoid-associated protein YgaU
VAGGENVQDQLGVIQAEPETQFYTVVSGDTISRITKQFYGNAYKVF